jgi:UDP-3-O-[3-hydroxymyristoyl] glucosamine N-acyltransferase
MYTFAPAKPLRSRSRDAPIVRAARAATPRAGLEDIMARPLLDMPKLLDERGPELGVVEIRNASALSRVEQTGFVWTRQPGVACLAANRRYFDIALANPDVVAIIVPPGVAPYADESGKALVVSTIADQLYHFLHASQGPADAEEALQVDDSACVDATVVLRGAVSIGPGVRIGPRVVVSGPATIGRDVRIDAGAVIGCDGLYAKQVLGMRLNMPHYGGVEVGAGAYIHAGAVVVRSAVRGESTRIGRGAHVGVLSNVGHDVEIGESATISSNCVLAGRARIGARAWIGASATVSNLVQVGEGAEVRIGAVVVQDVPAGGEVSGNFAMPHARNLKRFLRDSRHGA